MLNNVIQSLYWSRYCVVGKLPIRELYDSKTIILIANTLSIRKTFKEIENMYIDWYVWKIRVVNNVNEVMNTVELSKWAVCH